MVMIIITMHLSVMYCHRTVDRLVCLGSKCSNLRMQKMIEKVLIKSKSQEVKMLHKDCFRMHLEEMITRNKQRSKRK